MKAKFMKQFFHDFVPNHEYKYDWHGNMNFRVKNLILEI